MITAPCAVPSSEPSSSPSFFLSWRLKPVKAVKKRTLRKNTAVSHHRILFVKKNARNSICFGSSASPLTEMKFSTLFLFAATTKSIAEAFTVLPRMGSSCASSSSSSSSLYFIVDGPSDSSSFEYFGNDVITVIKRIDMDSIRRAASSGSASSEQIHWMLEALETMENSCTEGEFFSSSTPRSWSYSLLTGAALPPQNAARPTRNAPSKPRPSDSTTRQCSGRRG